LAEVGSILGEIDVYFMTIAWRPMSTDGVDEHGPAVFIKITTHLGTHQGMPA
jgi:hypothetical protein